MGRIISTFIVGGVGSTLLSENPKPTSVLNRMPQDEEEHEVSISIGDTKLSFKSSKSTEDAVAMLLFKLMSMGVRL